MRAIVINSHGGLEQLTLADIPIPEPGPGEVRVKMFASGVNPVDVLIREAAVILLASTKAQPVD